MLTKNINFKNFKKLNKKKNKKILKILESLFNKKNEILNSLKKNYQNSYNKKQIIKYKNY